MDSVDIKILHSMSRQLLVQTEGKMTLSMHLVYMSQQEVYTLYICNVAQGRVFSLKLLHVYREDVCSCSL